MLLFEGVLGGDKKSMSFFRFLFEKKSKQKNFGIMLLFEGVLGGDKKSMSFFRFLFEKKSKQKNFIYFYSEERSFLPLSF